MSVRIETEGARVLVTALDSESSTPESLDVVLAANDFFLSFYETMNVDKKTIYGMISNPHEKCESDQLDRLRRGFAEAALDSNAVRARLDELDAIDAEAVSETVDRYLPDGSSIDTTVHATIDGFNGGFQFQGDVGISVVGPLADEVRTVLLHELHHAGLFDLIEGTSLWDTAFEESSPEADAVEFLVHLLGEGLAIHYAQGGLSTFNNPRILSTIEQYRDQEQDLFADIESALRTTIETTDEAKRRATLGSMKQSETEHMAPVHFIGARMVATADEVYETDTVVDCATDPCSFLELYQSAANESGAYAFDPELIDDVVGLQPM